MEFTLALEFTFSSQPCHIPFKCYSSKILISDGFTAISFPESNSRMARFALRQLPVFWWQEAGVSLRMWLMKNSVKIVKLFLSPFLHT